MLLVGLASQFVEARSWNRYCCFGPSRRYSSNTIGSYLNPIWRGPVDLGTLPEGSTWCGTLSAGRVAESEVANRDRIRSCRAITYGLQSADSSSWFIVLLNQDYSIYPNYQCLGDFQIASFVGESGAWLCYWAFQFWCRWQFAHLGLFLASFSFPFECFLVGSIGVSWLVFYILRSVGISLLILRYWEFLPAFHGS